VSWHAAPDRRLHHGMPLSSIAAAANLVEEDKLFRISLELPGIDAKDVDASISDSALTIKAEKKNEREEHAQSYYLREREYGRSND
jgi:HSP20 family protein